MYSTYQLNKQEQADHTRQAAIAKPVRKIPEKPELVVSSSCRGTKAAFGVMRHSDEFIAKSGNGLCQLNQVLRVYDCCVAVAHPLDRSLRSSAAATRSEGNSDCGSLLANDLREQARSHSYSFPAAEERSDAADINPPRQCLHDADRHRQSNRPGRA